MSSICNNFTILKNKYDQPGVKTIRFITDAGEQKVIRIDPYSEMIAITAFPIRGPLLKSRLADRGFFIGPDSGALESFFHALIFPEDVMSTYGIKIQIKDMPENLNIETVSSYDDIVTVNDVEKISEL